MGPKHDAVDGDSHLWEEVRGARNGGGTRVHILAGIGHTTGAVIVQENVSETNNETTYSKPPAGRCLRSEERDYIRRRAAYPA